LAFSTFANSMTTLLSASSFAISETSGIATSLNSNPDVKIVLPQDIKSFLQAAQDSDRAG